MKTPPNSTWQFPTSSHSTIINIDGSTSTNDTGTVIRLNMPTNFASLIGFLAGSTSSSYTNTTLYSVITPIYQQVQSLLITTNIVNNDLNQNPGVIGCVSLTSNFESLINSEPSQLIWNECMPGQYQYLRVTILDQLFRNVLVRDRDVTLQFVLEQFEEM